MIEDEQYYPKQPENPAYKQLAFLANGSALQTRELNQMQINGQRQNCELSESLLGEFRVFSGDILVEKDRVTLKNFEIIVEGHKYKIDTTSVEKKPYIHIKIKKELVRPDSDSMLNEPAKTENFKNPGASRISHLVAVFSSEKKEESNAFLLVSVHPNAATFPNPKPSLQAYDYVLDLNKYALDFSKFPDGSRVLVDGGRYIAKNKIIINKKSINITFSPRVIIEIADGVADGDGDSAGLFQTSGLISIQNFVGGWFNEQTEPDPKNSCIFLAKKGMLTLQFCKGIGSKANRYQIASNIDAGLEKNSSNVVLHPEALKFLD